MGVAVVTGSAGLIGAEAVRFLSEQGFTVIGIDNDMRRQFFGDSASTDRTRRELERTCRNYRHHSLDIRNLEGIKAIYADYRDDIRLVIHTAAQPSHDWAAKEPFTDFTINANGTLGLLEYTRQFAPDACFIFTSTNKVYGDLPNQLPLVELGTRWELNDAHPWHERGIPEEMSIDQSKHSLFGASKVAADVLVQEYGRYFGMKTAAFRCGCLTGPGHAGAQLHGFLSYLVQCVAHRRPYTVLGYKGKQVRDNIHAYDLVQMFWHFFQNPRVGEVYNAGGGRHSNCSMLEAIQLAEEISGTKLDWQYSDNARSGDHIWWVSDVSKFRSHYPKWDYRYDLSAIIRELYEAAVRGS